MQGFLPVYLQMAAQSNLRVLEGLWEVMSNLTSTSSAADIAKITPFYSPTAVVFLHGMSTPPSTGHEEVLKSTTQLMRYWAMHKLVVTSTVVSADGKQVARAMKNHLKILGRDVEDFHECEVVTFGEDGLIERYELYCDPEPVKKVFQDAAAGSS